MDNLKCLLGIRRMDKRPNVWIRELYGVVKVVNERIDEILREWEMIGLLKGYM